MLLFGYCLIIVSLSSFSHCNDDLETRLSKIERGQEKHEELLDKITQDFEQRQQDLEERVAKLEQLIRIGTLRSCAEYSQYGLKTDGFYMIDPDGPLLGHPPFQVFCNFTSGSTEVLHDTETLTEVEHCHDPGKYFSEEL